jgi:hypothetical protein
MHGRESFDDLVQEAYLVYLKVHRRYARTVNKPQWLMALYRESLQRRLTDLARRSTHRSSCELIGVDVSHLSDDRFAPIDSVRELIDAIEAAPHELRAVLLVLLKAPDELLATLQQAARRSPTKASLMMCFLTGLPDDPELWPRARNYLTERLQ